MRSHIMKEPEVKKILLTGMHFRSTLEESAIARKENDHDRSHSLTQQRTSPGKVKRYLTKMGRGCHNEA